MKSTIAISVIVTSAVSALTIPSDVSNRDTLPYPHALLKAIHKRDLAVRATDMYGQPIGSSDGCWVPNCNDYYGGTWIGTGPEPYSPEWFKQNGLGGSNSYSTGGSSSSSVTDAGSTGSSGPTVDPSSSSSTGSAEPSSCQSVCGEIMSAAQSCVTSTDMLCGCEVILATGQACADCFQPINLTVSVVILNGMQTCSSENTGSTGSTGTGSSGSTGTTGSGSTATAGSGSKTSSGAGGSTGTNGAQGSGTAVPVNGSSGAEKAVVMGVSMVLVGLVGAFIL